MAVFVFSLMVLLLISIVVVLFGRASEEIENENALGRKKGKLYSELKIHLITRGLGQEEDVYHLKGVVDGINYDIQVNESEYEFYKNRYYEETQE
ncbi:TPA: hypothetical protein ACS8CE_003484 [Providencia alcalifaciens]